MRMDEPRYSFYPTGKNGHFSPNRARRGAQSSTPTPLCAPRSRGAPRLPCYLVSQSIFFFLPPSFLPSLAPSLTPSITNHVASTTPVSHSRATPPRGPCLPPARH